VLLSLLMLDGFSFPTRDTHHGSMFNHLSVKSFFP
jgi:hypothetical protein